jgi:NADH:ubiquinone oxidoreductase subunit 6 (subunit J)
MEKVYLIISSIASAIIFILLGFWLVAGGSDGFVFVLRTVFIGGIPIAFWFPAALVSFAVALKIPKEKKNLKNVLLALPILTLILMITAGEYHGP